MKTLFYRSDMCSFRFGIFIFSVLWIVGVLLGLITASSLIDSHPVASVSSSVSTVFFGHVLSLIAPLITAVILVRFMQYFLLCVLLLAKAFLLGFSFLFLIHNAVGMRAFVSLSLLPNCCSILILWFCFCSLFIKPNFQKSIVINMIFPIWFICITDIVFLIL